MPKIINVDVPLPSRPTKALLLGDNGASTLHVCMEGVDVDTGERGLMTLDAKPFYLPADDSTVVVLKVRSREAP